MTEGLLKRVLNKALPYINKCVICGIEKGVKQHLCLRCSDKLRVSVYGESTVKGYASYSAYKYEDNARKLVRNFKYHDSRYLAKFMAAKMVEGIPDSCSLITNVPLHDKKRKQRGFDQAELLAKEIANITGIPFVKAIKRVRNTQSQTKLDTTEREQNIVGAFESCVSASGKVVLVDDVLTTGATALECAKVLEQSGADEVFVLTFARALYSSKKSSLFSRWLRKIF